MCEMHRFANSFLLSQINQRTCVQLCCILVINVLAWLMVGLAAKANHTKEVHRKCNDWDVELAENDCVNRENYTVISIQLLYLRVTCRTFPELTWC